ncbi:MAG: vWA domain-containing protein [Dehalococcoidia bacterium]
MHERLSLTHLAIALAGAVLVAAAAVGSVAAQVPPADPAPFVPTLPPPPPPEFFDIASVEHDPSGRLVVSLSVPQEVELQRSRLTALVDGKRRFVREVIQRPPEPISVVIAIDASGSMDGDPVVAARQAALDLVERLNPDDQVAVIAFSDEPVVLSQFTTERATTVSTINSVVAGGFTALYGAVGAAADLLEDVDTDEKVLVLLSDGLDSAEPTVGRDESIAAITLSGASVYSFALQLQGEVDVSYLSALADRTGGEFSEVAGEQALGALFASLGQRLGAAVSVTVDVAPLAIGEHDLTLQFVVGPLRVQSDFDFDVENAGMITVTIVEPLPPAPVAVSDEDGEGAAASDDEGEAEPIEPDDAIIIRIDSPVDLHSFELRVTIGDADPVIVSAATDRLFVDPWRFEPGPVDVRVEALVERDGTVSLAGESVLTVEVPQLEPELVLRRSGSGLSRMLFVTARVQAVAGPVIRILIDGEEIADSTSQMAIARFAEALAVAAAEALEEQLASRDPGEEEAEPPAAAAAAAAAAAPAAPAPEEPSAPPEPPAPPSFGEAVYAFAPAPAEGEIEVRLEMPDGETVVTQLLAVTRERLVPVPAEEASAPAEGNAPLFAALLLAALAALVSGVVVIARRSE